MDIERKVLLLAIYKKQEDETLTDVVVSLESSKVFSMKEGKKHLKELKSQNLISGTKLTLAGIAQAKLVEEEFKI